MVILGLLVGLSVINESISCTDYIFIKITVISKRFIYK